MRKFAEKHLKLILKKLLKWQSRILFILIAQPITQNTPKMANYDYDKVNREGFMQFFRDDEKINELTADDRMEIFRTILVGSSDITKKLLNDVISDYSVSSLKVIDIENDQE